LSELSCVELGDVLSCMSTDLVATKHDKTKGRGALVYSFFNYQHIEDLLLTKHTPQGYRVYSALGRYFFRPFMKSFLAEYSHKVYVLGIDEVIKGGYSHVACLTHAMKISHSKVLHAKLLAQNPVKYAGQSLAYRLAHPRQFIYTGPSKISVILVDDIVTTGSTLREAKHLLEDQGVEVLFALSLADARMP